MLDTLEKRDGEKTPFAGVCIFSKWCISSSSYGLISRHILSSGDSIQYDVYRAIRLWIRMSRASEEVNNKTSFLTCFKN